MIQDLIKRYATIRTLYLFFLFVIVVSLPLSKYLASAAQILLIIVWLADAGFDEKWRRIKSNPHILVFTLLFVIPLLGMVYSRDLSYGFSDLRVKLPLLFLPLILGSIKPLDYHEMRVILGGFVTAVLVGALISLSIMLGIGPSDYTSDRASILFISHIRFALMVVLAVFILFYYAFDSKTPSPYNYLLIPVALLLILFLFMLKSLTGVVILVAGGMLLSLRWGLKQPDLMARWFVVVGFATLPVLAGIYLTGQAARFYTIRENPGEPDLLTARGNPYRHDTANPMIENGYYVGLYQCEAEMREAWNTASTMDYDGADRKGQELKYTLIRYLTSMGLRKDAHGVSKLSPDDIRMIENGFANCIYKKPKRFQVRIYETIWEIDQYRKGANPSGHSVTQRLEYLKTGWAIFMDHPVLGVGTGDLKNAFDQKYEELKSPLDPAWRFRAHNQFLTFLITYGIIGFVLLLTAIILPVIAATRKNPYFIWMFLLVALLSMLNEDTLETQAGVAFFAVFYCLFVFADGTADKAIRK
jgi:O-antigen ligase